MADLIINGKRPDDLVYNILKGDYYELVKEVYYQDTLVWQRNPNTKFIYFPVKEDD